MSSNILSPKGPSNFSSYSKILEYFNSVVGAFIRENVRDLIDRYSLHCSRSTFHWCVLVAGFRRWRSKTEDARVLLILPKFCCHTEKWCTKYAAILHPRGKIKRHFDRFQRKTFLFKLSKRFFFPVKGTPLPKIINLF